MEFSIRIKERAAFRGASKRVLEGVGDDGRDYEIQQTFKGWEIHVRKDGFLDEGYVFVWVQSALAAANEINAGCFDVTKAQEILRNDYHCHACGAETDPTEAACLECSHIKNWG